MAVNEITLSGNLTADPERRETQSGGSLTTFRLASTGRRYDKGVDQWRDASTVFINVSCWRGIADNVARSLRKGDTVLVTGRLSQHSWSAEEGVTRSRYEVAASTVALDLSRCAATPERRPVDPEPGARSAHVEAGVDLTTGEPLVDPDGVEPSPWDEGAPVEADDEDLVPAG